MGQAIAITAFPECFSPEELAAHQGAGHVELRTPPGSGKSWIDVDVS